jgi:hypothetical protein
VNYEIVELEQLSGRKATIYSIIKEDDDITLFDQFLAENIQSHRSEIKYISNILEEIGHEVGAREQFFKHDEGKLGDGVCALYDDPDRKLRLYCIRYGRCAIILGGGGPKHPDIKAWQENDKLALEAKTMIKVSKDITRRLKDGDLRWSPDGTQLIGDLTFSDNDE